MTDQELINQQLIEEATALENELMEILSHAENAVVVLMAINHIQARIVLGLPSDEMRASVLYPLNKFLGETMDATLSRLVSSEGQTLQ